SPAGSLRGELPFTSEPSSTLLCITQRSPCSAFLGFRGFCIANDETVADVVPAVSNESVIGFKDGKSWRGHSRATWEICCSDAPSSNGNIDAATDAPKAHAGIHGRRRFDHRDNPRRVSKYEGSGYNNRVVAGHLNIGVTLNVYADKFHEAQHRDDLFARIKRSGFAAI